MKMNNPLQQTKRPNGFTLIEVLIVMAIIVALAGIGFSGWGFAMNLKSEKTAEVQIKLLENALEEYKMDDGGYPTGTNSNALYLALSGDGNDDGVADDATVYLSELNASTNPQKMVDLVGTTHVLLDPWGKEYNYLSPGTNNPDFDLWSLGKDETTGTADDITNW